MAHAIELVKARERMRRWLLSSLRPTFQNTFSLRARPMDDKRCVLVLHGYTESGDWDHINPAIMHRIESLGVQLERGNKVKIKGMSNKNLHKLGVFHAIIDIDQPACPQPRCRKLSCDVDAEKGKQ